MEWQAHKGTVNKLSWAHPEYGQLLASCGSDHAVIIWEEREQQLQQQQEGSSSMGVATPASTSSATHWVCKAQLTDARKSVTCVAFAPRHLGLKIAAGSADGIVRIYEAIDVMNLNHWPLNGSIDAESMVSVSTTGSMVTTEDELAQLGVASLSWCNARFGEPPTLVIGTGNGNVAVYRYSDAARQWQVILKLPGHPRGVLDVAWAPNVGRSFHLIATAGKDRALRVHKLKRIRGGNSNEGGSNPVGPSLELESSQVLQTGVSGVWKCAWNVTGTVLASSGDGGMVQMWKSDFHNQWKCVAEVRGNVGSEEDTAEPMVE